MDLELKGKTALVLGAGGGLGAAIARSLAAEGVGVAVADIDGDAARRTVEEIEARCSRALPLKWDLGALESIDGHVRTVEAGLGPIDILVNNTGGPPRHLRQDSRPPSGDSISKAWCCR